MSWHDPEWGRAFWTGSVAAPCDHDRMLRSVGVPVLFTHHVRHVVDSTGLLMGASSDIRAARVREILTDAGVAVDYRSFEAIGHSLHGQDPAPVRVGTLRPRLPSIPRRSMTEDVPTDRRHEAGDDHAVPVDPPEVVGPVERVAVGAGT